MSNFDDCNNYCPPLPEHGQGSRCDQSSPEALDNLKRDRFELLSAYLDGEVTADERRQVEAWLETDPQIQRLHARLLKLRHGLQVLPVPASNQPVEQVANQVITRIERRPKRTAAWGGMAIAALFVGALLGNLPDTRLSPLMVQTPALDQPASSTVPNEGLMIALDRPVIEIPAAVLESGYQHRENLQ
jgi:anti-sigma factor RsiW